MSDSSPTVDRMKQAGTLTLIEDLVVEVGRFLERYDCQNPDLTIDPFDLLRECKRALAKVDDAFENLKRELEGKDELHADEMSTLRKEIAKLKSDHAKLEALPWVRPYLNG